MTASASHADQARVVAILRDLCEAASGRDLVTVIPPLCRAVAAVYAHFGCVAPLVFEDRQALLTALRRAENAAEAVLPAAYFDGRGRQGFVSAFGLLYGSGEAADPSDRVITGDDARTLALTLRVFVNDLDSICTALTLAQFDPTALPLAVLLGVPYSLEPEPQPAVTKH